MTQKIWISYHKDEQIEQYGLKEDATHILFPTHKEAEKRNINNLNPAYSEMVTMWYVWKNNLRSDYVGFEHYRRHFSAVRTPQKGECQVYKVMDFLFESVYDQYARCHRKEDMDVMLSCVDRRYGEGNPYTRNIRECHSLISNCCFIMQWGDFTKMCSFLFPLLDDFASEFGISNTNVEEWRKKALRDFGDSSKIAYQTRILSFLAERLISAWIMTNLVPLEEGKTVAVVHYNTPELLEKTILSLRKNAPGCRVLVFDNSDREPFKKKMTGVGVIDNTRGQKIDFKKWLEGFPDKEETTNDYGSAKHCYSIQWLIDHVEEPFLLMDSDILIQKNIGFFFDNRYLFAGAIGSDTFYQGFPLKRVLPILCYLNVPMIRENGIRYFNPEYMWNLISTGPNDHYDTGAWFYKEAMEKGMRWQNVEITNYMKHLWHGSWVDDKERIEKWLEENKALWE